MPLVKFFGTRKFGTFGTFVCGQLHSSQQQTKVPKESSECLEK